MEALRMAHHPTPDRRRPAWREHPLVSVYWCSQGMSPSSRWRRTTHHYTVWRCAGSREMRRSLVKRYSYSERDYAFGQMMLSLRMRISLTQAGLAALLHVQRRSVAGWEAGSSYPKAEHLKELIALGVEQQAWAFGREAEEIRALW